MVSRNPGKDFAFEVNTTISCPLTVSVPKSQGYHAAFYPHKSENRNEISSTLPVQPPDCVLSLLAKKNMTRVVTRSFRA